MVTNLKLIFIHGIHDQRTSYSNELFELILRAARRRLQARGQSAELTEQTLRRLVHHEILWANLTTDLTNRYMQLAYEGQKLPWGFLTKPLDPLAIQIMTYIKDKGDKSTGNETMLRQVSADFNAIFAEDDIGMTPSQPTRQHAIIIAHSLGSVIAFDYVMGFREHRLPAGVTLHNFVTMGSPIPVFVSAMGHPDSDLTLPPAVHQWTNLRSRYDGIARPIKPFFRQMPIDEQIVGTGFWPLSAHSGYWRSRQVADLIADSALKALKSS
jgi:hypothetical protein